MHLSRLPRLLRAAATIAAGILAMPAVMMAHDFWIEPSAFRVAPGALVRVALRVGHVFDGDPVVRDPSRFQQFVIADRDGVRPILGQDSVDPAGLLRPSTAEGVHVIGYHSLPVPHWLEARAFERYLHEEGLDAINDRRNLRGEHDLPGREVFSRTAKALVAVGDGSAGGYDRRLGLPLELFVEANPYQSVMGDVLPVRLLYLGIPLRDAVVTAFNEHAPDQPERARTDAGGRVSVSVNRPGRWLIKSVHMVPAAPGVDADWESFWASLTFEISR